MLVLFKHQFSIFVLFWITLHHFFRSVETQCSQFQYRLWGLCSLLRWHSKACFKKILMPLSLITEEDLANPATSYFTTILALYVIVTPVHDVQQYHVFQHLLVKLLVLLVTWHWQLCCVTLCNPMDACIDSSTNFCFVNVCFPWFTCSSFPKYFAFSYSFGFFLCRRVWSTKNAFTF